MPPHIAVGVNLSMYLRRASVEKRDIASKSGPNTSNLHVRQDVPRINQDNTYRTADTYMFIDMLVMVT